MSNYPGDLEVSGECILLSSVSSQQKFEAPDVRSSVCHSSRTDRVIALGPRTDRFIALGSQTDHVIALRECYRSVLQLSFI